MTLPIVLLLMIMTLAVSRAYLVRQRTCVVAQHAAWRAAQEGEAPSDRDVQTVTVAPRAHRDVSDEAAYSGFGLHGVSSGMGWLSIDSTCTPLAPDPRVTVTAPLRWRSRRLTYAGDIVCSRKIERDLWVTPKSREGLFGFFLGGIAQRFGLNPLRIP